MNDQDILEIKQALSLIIAQVGTIKDRLAVVEEWILNDCGPETDLFRHVPGNVRSRKSAGFPQPDNQPPF